MPLKSDALKCVPELLRLWLRRPPPPPDPKHTHTHDLPLTVTGMQLADEGGLEEVRDGMKALKRLCRQRTLLSWKKGRIQQEQERAAGWRSALVAAEEEEAAMKVTVCAGGGGGGGRVPAGHASCPHMFHGYVTA